MMARGEIGEAGLGRDRESVGNRQAHVVHLGEVRALPAEQVLHILVALGEVVDVLGHQGSPPDELGSERSVYRRGGGRLQSVIGAAACCQSSEASASRTTLAARRRQRLRPSL